MFYQIDTEPFLYTTALQTFLKKLCLFVCKHVCVHERDF